MEKGHGRIETRTLRSSTALNDYLDFPYCGQVFELRRERRLVSRGKVERETVHGITSLTPDRANTERLLKLTRDHWSIENRSHWVRDWNYDEDRSQIRKGKAPQMMACLRNVALNILRLHGCANIALALRSCSASTVQVLRYLRL